MKKHKGQAILEFALVLPILLLLVFGIIDFGRALYTANTLNMVSQEAARYASLDATRTDAQIDAYVRAHAVVEDTSTSALTVDVDPKPKRSSGGNVTVQISYKFYYVTPFMNGILPSPLILNAETTIRVE